MFARIDPVLKGFMKLGKPLVLVYVIEISEWVSDSLAKCLIGFTISNWLTDWGFWGFSRNVVGN